MPGEDAFCVEGVITEVRANGTYGVRLTNGHCFMGFVAGRRAKLAFAAKPGEKVRVRFSPADLSVGRILGKVESI